MSRKETMRETVIFDGRTGSVIAIAGEVDVEHVEALILEVADGMRVDSVDVSGEEPVPVLSATPASWQARLEAAIKRSDERCASLETRVLEMFNDMMKGEEADEDSEGTV